MTLKIIIDEEEKYHFSEKVIKFITDHNYEYINGLMEFCLKESIEFDEITGLISDKLYQLLQKEAIDNKLIKKTNNILL